MTNCNQCGQQQCQQTGHVCVLHQGQIYPQVQMQQCQQTPPTPNLDNKILAMIEQILERLVSIESEVEHMRKYS